MNAHSNLGGPRDGSDPRPAPGADPRADAGAGGLVPADLERLVHIARRAVEHAVREGRSWRPDGNALPAPLRRPGGAFVTLHEHGRLRGCVGRIESTEPLAITVAAVARSAALEDPRFPPVRSGELPDLEVSVSVLTPAQELAVDSYDELLRTVRPGVDGLVVDAGRHRATLLPAVWADLRHSSAFLEALWHKAGLAPRAWPAGIVVSRYHAQEAAES